MECEAFGPRGLYVTQAAPWKYTNEHQGKLSWELGLTSNLGCKLLRERKASMSHRTENDAQEQAVLETGIQIKLALSNSLFYRPKGSPSVFVSFSGSVKSTLERIFVPSQNNYGEH